MRRWTALALTLALLIPLTGCWDYRGLNELTLVAGIAIDRDADNPEQYYVTFEIIDSQASNSDTGATGSLVHSYGKTLFEAVFNAGRQLHNEMYFGNTEILIISEQVAREDGVAGIFESIMRDFDTRESIMILISRAPTARDILTSSDDSEGVAAYRISKGLSNPHLGINTTKAYSVAHGYDILKGDASEMTHAALTVVEDEQGRRIPTVDGIGVFEDDRLIGFLEQEYMEPYLLTIENVNDGIINFPIESPDFSKPTLISMNLSYKTGALYCKMIDGKPYMWVDVELLVHAVELSPYLTKLDENVMQTIARVGESVVEQRLISLFEYSQATFELEVFGFANALKRAEPKTWEAIKDDWDALFMQGSFDANCHIVIRNSGQIYQF